MADQDPLMGYEEEDLLAGYEDESYDDVGGEVDEEEEEWMVQRNRAVEREARRSRGRNYGVYDEDEHSAYDAFHEGEGRDLEAVLWPQRREENGDSPATGEEERDEGERWVTARERFAREETEIDEEEEREGDEPQRNTDLTTLSKRVEEVQVSLETTSERRTWRENLTKKRKEGKLAMSILALKIWHHEKTVKSAPDYQEKEDAEEIRRRSRAREHTHRMVKWEAEEERMKRGHRVVRYSNAYMEYQRYVSNGRTELDRQLYGCQLRSRPSESVAEMEGRKRQELEDAERKANAKEARRLGRLRRKIEKDTQDRGKEPQLVFKRAVKRERCEGWKNQLAALQSAADGKKTTKKAKKEAKQEVSQEARQEAIRLRHERQRIYETARLEREKAKKAEKERRTVQKREEKEERARRWEEGERVERGVREEQRRKSGNASTVPLFMITTMML